MGKRGGVGGERYVREVGKKGRKEIWGREVGKDGM